jgi:fatty-acid desaturase
MEDNINNFESLLESAVDYGKTGFELAKLKTLDKTSDVVSSLMANYLVLILIASFILFITLGMGYWLGEILGKIYFGFFAVAVFYAITGIILNFFLHKTIKRMIADYLIKKVLK